MVAAFFGRSLGDSAASKENEATTTRPGEAFRGQEIPHWHGRAFVSSDVGPLCVLGAQDPPCEAWRSMVTPTDQARSREGREGRGDGRRGLDPASGGALRACRMLPPRTAPAGSHPGISWDILRLSRDIPGCAPETADRLPSKPSPKWPPLHGRSYFFRMPHLGSKPPAMRGCAK